MTATSPRVEDSVCFCSGQLTEYVTWSGLQWGNLHRPAQDKLQCNRAANILFHLFLFHSFFYHRLLYVKKKTEIDTLDALGDAMTTILTIILTTSPDDQPWRPIWSNNRQYLTKSWKHEFLTHSPIWIKKMLAHLKTFFLINGKKTFAWCDPPAG